MLYRPSSFRKKATAVAAATAMMGAASFATDAQAGDFTHEQCKIIAGITTDTMNAIGTNKLSPEFRGSIVKFIAPEGQLTCDGPKDILTPRGKDVDAFVVIRAVLLSRAGGGSISLEKAGLRSVDPATLASQRPADGRRSELNAAPRVE
jgi:hypothetical protein